VEEEDLIFGVYDDDAGYLSVLALELFVMTRISSRSQYSILHKNNAKNKKPESDQR
jgi:hypothetical protein